MSGLKQLLTTTVAALALAAFALPAAPARAQVLDIATDASPVGLDPHDATSFATFIVVSNVYEGLTAIDKDLRIVPALADKWTISADGLTYDFHLRPGAMFHNGRALTPQDIIAKINADTNAALVHPSVKPRFDDLGANPKGSTPAELAAFLKSEIDKWGPVIQEAKIKVEN